jgi:serine/threonine protein kinase
MHHLLKTLIETAYAMKHLHNSHILHRDLKIQNILLKTSNRDDRGFTVKVSDFGLAKVWDGRGGNSPTEKHKYAGVQPARLAGPETVLSKSCPHQVLQALSTVMRSLLQAL